MGKKTKKGRRMDTKSCPANTASTRVDIPTTAITGYCQEMLHHTLPQIYFNHFSDCEVKTLG